jgi:hypothetical protein
MISMKETGVLVALASAVSCHSTTAFLSVAPLQSTRHQQLRVKPSFIIAAVVDSNSESNDSSSSKTGSDSDSGSTMMIDVSDLGLTMDDFNAPLPPEFFEGMSSTGYESISRPPDNDDKGCQWVETADQIEAALKIPGLRGQPAAAMAVIFSTTTICVSVFGRVVWSAVLRGTVDDPNLCKFEVEEQEDMIPLITIQLPKQQDNKRWGGLIAQIGEDSLL